MKHYSQARSLCYSKRCSILLSHYVLPPNMAACCLHRGLKCVPPDKSCLTRRENALFRYTGLWKLNSAKIQGLTNQPCLSHAYIIVMWCVYLFIVWKDEWIKVCLRLKLMWNESVFDSLSLWGMSNFSNMNNWKLSEKTKFIFRKA